jgi:ubiquinone/menaquinone biosynthesis C-methylase UbiE
MDGYRPLQMLKDAAKKRLPGAYARYVRWQYDRVPLTRRIAPILASDSQSTCYDEHFEKLQNSYTQWWPEYSYDEYSTWTRGYERAMKLLAISELRSRDLAVFEAGCGDGMTTYAIASYGKVGKIVLNDTEDWRDKRAMSFPFLKGNICQRLPIDSESFDLAITYNTFEHIEDPGAALFELVRLCKRGGYIHIDFNPLYCSPLGLHAFSFLMPYPQFLFSSTLIEAKVRELGVKDLGQKFDRLQPTNKWRLAQFRDLWRGSACDVVSLVEGREGRHLGVVTAFPRAFCGRGLTVEDLVVGGVSVLLRKK